MTALKLGLWRGCYMVVTQPIILWARGMLCLSRLIEGAVT